MDTSDARVGPYVLLSPLGEGGMGVVHLARHHRTGEEVALKTVTGAEPTLLRGIRREIESLGALRHPGVVRVVDHGTHEGLPWYAMERVVGTPLTTWVDAADDRVAAAIAVVHRMCDALAFLHGEGVVHRDLKPTNVIVKADGMPVLIDFGLAERFRARDGREGLASTTGTSGTVRWMAPEVITGQIVDARADLYAVGCILYALLSGAPPFDGDMKTVLRGHLGREPAPIPGLDPRLSEVLARLLAKAPADRLGYADTLAAQLEELGAPHGRSVPARPYLYRPRLRGRTRELGAVHRGLERLSGGGGGVTLIGGESGVGKTRLALEVAKEAGRYDLEVATGTATEGQPRALGPFERVLAEVPDHDPLATEEGAAGVVRSRILDALDAALAARLAGRPLVLLLDDLQWADELSLRWLARTAAEPGLPLWVVGTYRTEEVGPLLQVVRDAAEDLVLGRLDGEAIDALITDMLALPEPPERLCAQLRRASEGNPFFAAEYLRVAVDEGMVRRDAAGRWVVGEIDALPLPSNLRALAARRLQGLELAHAAVAEAAAVVGPEVAFGLILEVCDLDEPGLHAAIAELVRRDVLEDAPGDRVRFTHDKLREGILAGVAPARRTELHAGIAAYLSIHEPEAHMALGRHHAAAGRPDLARPHLLAAADAAMRSGALADAEPLYVEYLALVQEPDEESVLARARYGAKILQVVGRMDDAVAEQERALAEARACGSRAGEAESLRALGVAQTRQGNLDAAQVRLEQAIPILAEIGDLTNEGNAWGNLATVYYYRGQYDAFKVHTLRAIDTVRRSGDRRSEGVWLGNLATVHHTLGEYDEAEALYLRALAMHDEVGNRRSKALHLGNLATMRMTRGDFDGAESLYDEAVAIHRAVGNRPEEAMCLANLGELCLSRVRLPRARELFAEARALAEQAKLPRLVGFCASRLADDARRFRGALDEARTLGEGAVDVLRGSGDRLEYAKGLAMLGHVRLACGVDADDLAAELREVVGGLGLLDDPEIAGRLADLEAACRARAGGEALFRGEVWERIPERPRRWLEMTGQHAAS